MKKVLSARVGLRIFLGFCLAALGMTISENSFAQPSFGYIKNNLDGSQSLTGHVPMEIKNGQATFKHHASQNISAQVIMPLANQSQLGSLLQDLYDPKSPNYHHFLSSVQFAQQFAPSSIDSMQVQEFLQNKGIFVTGQSPNGAVIYVTGPVQAFEQAFGLRINNYQKNDGTLFFGPDTEPTIPANLAGKILAVGGLDNLPKYMAHRHQALNAPSKAVGSGPGGYLAPSDVKTAYNLNSVPTQVSQLPAGVQSGAQQQTVALFELDGYNPSDITTYLSYFKISSNNISSPCNYTSSTPNTPINFSNPPNGSCGSNILQNILMDGFSGVPNWPSQGPYEVTLDIDLVAAFAPGSKNILVYEAPNTTQGWIDEWTQIATDNKAKTISCSWGEPEMDSPTISFDNTIFSQMAAQGQAIFVAAGDNGAYDAGGKTLAVDEPASQSYVTAVGISALTMNPGFTYKSETASVDGGGGVSTYSLIPAYQTTLAGTAVSAAKVSKTHRNLPDVALTADSSTLYAFYMSIPGAKGWYGFWGSSLAAPIWASFTSLVNLGLGANAPIGFANVPFYQIAQTANYAKDFNDITTGNNGYYSAESGFDDASGLGSFNGLNLYNDLLKNAAPVTIPAAPVGLSATGGVSQVSLSWTGSSGATSYNIYRATSSGGENFITPTYSGITTSSYTDTGVINGQVYYYVVRAVNAGGSSASSAQVSAIPVPPPVPSAPVGFNATAGNAQVALSWTASSGATSYNIYRATSSGGENFTTPTHSGITTSSYTDTGLTNGQVYYYVVRALNAGGSSANSAQVSATPVLPVPAAPVGLSATAGNAQVVLSWTASSGATSYNVKRGISSGTYTTSVTVTSTTYTDSSVSNGTTYYYVVSALNASGQSANSAQVSAKPLAPTAPSAPTGLSGSTTTNAGRPAILLRWTQSSSSNITSNSIYYSTGSSSSYTLLGSLSATTSALVTGVSTSTTYNFYVTANSNIGQSPASNKISLKG